jgi:hypothetical protein
MVKSSFVAMTRIQPGEPFRETSASGRQAAFAPGGQLQFQVVQVVTDELPDLGCVLLDTGREHQVDLFT